MNSAAPETLDFTPESSDFDGERRWVLRTPEGIAVTGHAAHHASARDCVILIPGWSGPRTGPAEILTMLASTLARNGYTALRLDMPARGDSDGPPESSGLDEMIAATLALARMHPNSQVHLVGMCSGGNVALGCAAQMPATSRIVAISTFPFQRSRSKSMDQKRRWKNLKNYAAKAFSPSSWMRLLRGEINMDRVKKNLNATDAKVAGARNLKDSARDIEAELAEWKGRAQFVWGGGDEEAPPSRQHFEKLHKEGMGARDGCDFLTVAGANHNFYGQDWRTELAERILAFLKK